MDCFGFRNKIGVDAAVEALKDYRRLRKGTADALWQQADRRRMSKVIGPYLDAMSSLARGWSRRAARLRASHGILLFRRMLHEGN